MYYVDDNDAIVLYGAGPRSKHRQPVDEPHTACSRWRCFKTPELQIYRRHGTERCSKRRAEYGVTNAVIIAC
jgi:hypothetical protein